MSWLNFQDGGWCHAQKRKQQSAAESAESAAAAESAESAAKSAAECAAECAAEPASHWGRRAPRQERISVFSGAEYLVSPACVPWELLPCRIHDLWHLRHNHRILRKHVWLEFPDLVVITRSDKEPVATRVLF